MNLAKSEVPAAPAPSAGSALGTACSSPQPRAVLSTLGVAARRNCGLGLFTALVGTRRDRDWGREAGGTGAGGTGAGGTLLPGCGRTGAPELLPAQSQWHQCPTSQAPWASCCRRVPGWMQGVLPRLAELPWGQQGCTSRDGHGLLHAVTASLVTQHMAGWVPRGGAASSPAFCPLAVACRDLPGLCLRPASGALPAGCHRTACDTGDAWVPVPCCPPCSSPPPPVLPRAVPFFPQGPCSGLGDASAGTGPVPLAPCPGCLE